MDGQHDVETSLELRPIAIDTGSPDRDGRLVIANGMLVAVLVHVGDFEHGVVRGWFMEVGLGRLRGLRSPIFDSLDDASQWLRQRLKPSALTRTHPPRAP